MITYETLRKIQTEEKTSSKLVKLPENFFVDVRAYLEKKKKLSNEKGNYLELQSANKILEEIFELREKKILNLAFYYIKGLKPENLTEEEKKFFEKVVENLKEFQKEKKRMMEKDEGEVVAIVENTPKFVGLNLKNYGPFKKGDIVVLPKENAKFLIEKKIAEKIHVGD